MNLHSVLILITLILSLQTFCFFFFKKEKTDLEKSFLLVVGPLILNLFFTLLLLDTKSQAMADICNRLLYIPRPLFFIGTYLVFTCFFQDGRLPSKPKLALLFLFSLPIIILGVSGIWGTARVIVSEAGNRIIIDRSSFLYFYFNVFLLYIIFRSAYLLILVRRKSDSNRLRRLSLFMIICLFQVWIGGIIIKYILPVLLGSGGIDYSLTYGYPFNSIGSFGAVFAYFRYSFMRDEIPITADLILENVEDGLLYADREGRITRSNPAACRLAECAPGELNGRNFRELFPDIRVVPEETPAVENAGISENSILRIYRKKGKQVEVVYNRLFDKFEDAVGYLVIFRRNIQLEEVIEKYNLSDREMEIINLMHRDLEYSSISEMLFISKHTVRNHVQHIYEKTGINSKAKLFKLLFG